MSRENYDTATAKVFQYPEDMNTWFAGMWHIGSWCEHTLIFDEESNELWDWGYSTPYTIPESKWTPAEQQSIDRIRGRSKEEK